jgi:integrase
MAHQAETFNQSIEPRSRCPGPAWDTEGILDQYRGLRTAQGASRRAVQREISQLRSIVRACSSEGEPRSFAEVMVDIPSIARVLREPLAPIAASTGRTRLIAVQRFLHLVGPALGRDPEADLAALDALLPAAPTASWHSVGTRVAGVTKPRRRRGPTLAPSDLDRIVMAASAEQSPFRALRDGALVAVHCFSGLRPEEVVALRWEDVGYHLIDLGYYGLRAFVTRNEQRWPLPLPGPSGDAVKALQEWIDSRGELRSGPVFSRDVGAERALSYRAAREVLIGACIRAGLPPVSAVELRAACAFWLRAQGLTDHEVAAVLGLSRVRSVDRLLRRHAALTAQRRVREHHPVWQ